jgi:hypothetical protein
MRNSLATLLPKSLLWVSALKHQTIDYNSAEVQLSLVNADFSSIEKALPAGKPRTVLNAYLLGCCTAKSSNKHSDPYRNEGFDSTELHAAWYKGLNDFLLTTEEFNVDKDKKEDHESN